MLYMYCCIKYRSWVKPLLHIQLLVQEIYHRFRIESKCLAMLRPVEAR